MPLAETGSGYNSIDLSDPKKCSTHDSRIHNEWRNRVSHYGFDHDVKMGLSGRFQQHPATCIGSSSMAPLMVIEI